MEPHTLAPELVLVDSEDVVVAHFEEKEPRGRLQLGDRGPVTIDDLPQRTTVHAAVNPRMDHLVREHDRFPPRRVGHHPDPVIRSRDKPCVARIVVRIDQRPAHGHALPRPRELHLADQLFPGVGGDGSRFERNGKGPDVLAAEAHREDRVRAGVAEIDAVVPDPVDPVPRIGMHGLGIRGPLKCGQPRDGIEAFGRRHESSDHHGSARLTGPRGRAFRAVGVSTDEDSVTQHDRTIGDQALATLDDPAMPGRRQVVSTRSRVPAIGPESGDLRRGKDQDRVPGSAGESLNRVDEFTRASALAAGVEEVRPLRIVVLQLRSAFVRDDDAAVAETGRSGDPVQQVAIALVRAADDDGGLFGEAPGWARVLRDGIRVVPACRASEQGREQERHHSAIEMPRSEWDGCHRRNLMSPTSYQSSARSGTPSASSGPSCRSTRTTSVEPRRSKARRRSLTLTDRTYSAFSYTSR